MRKNYFLIIIFLLAASFLSGQNVFNIADEGAHNFSCFSDSVIVVDSGGENGDYGPNETYEITFCIVAAGDVEVVISPGLFGDLWDVDGGSFLSVHNGNSSAAPQIGGGVFNSVNDPGGILVQTNGSGCITLVFSSGPASSGAGFTAHIRCKTAFQPFFVELTAEPEFQVTTVDSLSIAVCFADSFTVTATTDYPLSDASGNGYTQSDATSYFNWAMGDGTNLAGFGLTEISYAYASGSGHEINLSIIDASGTIKYDRFYVLQSPRPDFSNVALNDTLCIGSETVISGGINFFTQDTVGVGPGSGAILGGGSVGGQEEVFDADSTCTAYVIPLEITEFEEGQTLTNIEDLLNICFNMHHTYVGDLEMGLVCPGSSDTLILFDTRNFQGQCPNLFEGGSDGGGTNLGEPPVGVQPGVGYDYCFNSEPEFGTFTDVNVGLTGPMPTGTYETNTDINSLLGCPLNGTWQLVLLDGYGGDVGVLNSWSIFFNPDINPSTAYYTPEIVSAGWDENTDLIVNSDSISVTVAPSQDGDNSFTFFAYDEFGCRHDTTINIYVRPEINLDDDIACDLTQILSPYDDLDQSVRDGIYTVLDRPTPTADIIFEELSPSIDKATANEYGLYTLQITSADCGYTDEAVIDFRPDPVVAPLVSDTILCIGASIDLFAGQQEANSDNFDILWLSSNTGSFNTEDYLVTVDETGTYIVVLSGVCGFDSDTTNVVAITLDFDAKTVCSLQAFATATLAPDGPGFWSAPENISFSNANLLNTQVSSSQYGIYPITYTDNRCPDDALTRDFNFVEQPDAVIIPENPDFCIDQDDLIVSATVSGSFNGTYTWTLNGEPNTTQNDSLFFAHQPPGTDPRTFDPLKKYTFGVTVQDAYSVCPLATGEMSFIADWCEYTIPNVVTPNGDNRNDRFDVQFIENFPNSTLRVFDRWGKLVFEQADYDQYSKKDGSGWDASDVSAGTYYYELLIPYAKKVESGYIQVLKDK